MMLVIFWLVNGVGFLFNPNFLARTMFKLVNPRQLPHNNLNCQEMEPRVLHGKFFFFFLFYFLWNRRPNQPAPQWSFMASSEGEETPSWAAVEPGVAFASYVSVWMVPVWSLHIILWTKKETRGLLVVPWKDRQRTAPHSQVSPRVVLKRRLFATHAVSVSASPP